MTVQELIALFGLRPLAPEGGYFVETYRSDESVPAGALRARFGAGHPLRGDGAEPGGLGCDRPLSTAIYYLLTPDDFSAMHRLRSDEVFHFYYGDPVEMLLLSPGGGAATPRERGRAATAAGGARVVTLGTDFAAGMRPQLAVPRGVWQGARLAPGGRVALLGTTVAPGFDPADYEHGEREALIAAYPAHAEMIRALTRNSE